MASTSSQCSSGGLEECASLRVDIGSHWELAATDQGVEFPINSVDNGDVEDEYEYAVSPYCRKHDDNEEGGGSEWAGAWVYSDASSSYKFELSRLLTTDSPSTDAQFVAGEVYSFGVAFWDPNESETDGWSDHGHYVTGCAQDWTDLWLAKEGETEPPMMDGSNAGDNMMDGGSTASKQGVVLGMVVTIASFFATLF